MYSYSEQVEDIEHYNASIGDEFDAKMNSFRHINGFGYSKYSDYK